MKIQFTKMQGCGNDYVYINGFTQQISGERKPELARRLSDRHFGIGSDGVIFINPSSEADFEMEMFNGDGSRSEMCGNGIRCVAKYVFDRGMTSRTTFSIESGGQIKYVELFLKDGKTVSVRVDMGKPVLACAKIPVAVPKECALKEPIWVGGQEYRMTCVSMGNPHAVVFWEDLRTLPIETLGPLFEKHERFPNRINTEFVQVLGTDRVRMRVWERGAGETLACGTGCCATLVACALCEKTGKKATVEVLGGEVFVEWDEKTGHVFMTGPAAFVFDGETDYDYCE